MLSSYGYVFPMFAMFGDFNHVLCVLMLKCREFFLISIAEIRVISLFARQEVSINVQFHRTHIVLKN